MSSNASHDLLVYSVEATPYLTNSIKPYCCIHTAKSNLGSQIVSIFSIIYNKVTIKVK